MANITANKTYVNFSKLGEYNKSFPDVNVGSFESIQNDIFSTFANYTELQWFLSVLIFVAIFVLIRKIQFIDLTDMQIATLSSFVVVSMNSLLLIMDVFTIIQPLQFFLVLWLILVISMIANKRR